MKLSPSRRVIQGLAAGTCAVAILSSGGVLVSTGLAVAAPAAATKSFNLSYTTACNLGSLGTQDIPATGKGTYPATIKPGQKFTIALAQTVTIPADLATLGASEGMAYGEATISGDNATATDATPAKQQFVKTPFNTGKVPVTAGQASVLPIPRKGTKPVTLTATKAGTLKVTLGDVTGTFEGYNSSGGVVTSGPFDCDPTSTPTATITVS